MRNVRGAKCSVLVLALVLLPVRPASAQTATASLSGFVLGPDGTPMPWVSLELTSTRDRGVSGAAVTATGADGAFEFHSLAAGRYRLSVRPVIEMWRLFLPLDPREIGLDLADGQSMRRDITLSFAPVHAAFRVDAFGTARHHDLLPAAGNWSCLPDDPSLCGPPSLLREFENDRAVTGRILEKLRIVHATPILLAPLLRPLNDDARLVGGRIVVEGRIGIDGFAKNLQILSGTERRVVMDDSTELLTIPRTHHPDLAASALAALKEWRWEPARVNGTAVEVPVLISLDFVVP